MTTSWTSLAAARSQDLFEDRDGGLAAFEREALLADEAGVQEVLELFGVDQMCWRMRRRVSRSSGHWLASRLHALLQPALLLGHLDVHVLAADFAAVGLAQGFQNLAQGGDGLGAALADGLAEPAGEEFAVEIPDGEAVGFGVEFGMVAGLGAERIEIGDQVAAHAVGVDHLHDRRFLGDFGGARAAVMPGSSGLRSVSQCTGWCGMRRSAKISS